MVYVKKGEIKIEVDTKYGIEIRICPRDKIKIMRQDGEILTCRYLDGGKEDMEFIEIHG